VSVLFSCFRIFPSAIDFQISSSVTALELECDTKFQNHTKPEEIFTAEYTESITKPKVLVFLSFRVKGYRDNIHFVKCYLYCTYHISMQTGYSGCLYVVFLSPSRLMAEQHFVLPYTFRYE